MNSSRRKFAAILEALGMPPSTRRPAVTPVNPACESLEGRQLLTGGYGMGGLGMGIADVSGMGAGGWSGGAGAVVHGTTAIAVANPQAQAAITQLKTDTQTIQDQSLVTPAMTSTVTADTNAIKSAETTPANPTYLANLQTAIKAADATPGGPTVGQAFQLEIDQNVVYLSQGVSATLINQLDADEMTVFQATGLTPTDETTLATDYAAIKAAEPTVTPVMTAAATSTTAGSTTTGVTPTTSTAMPMMATPIGAPAGGVGVQGELAAVGASVVVPTLTATGTSAMGGGMSATSGLGLPYVPIQPTPSSPAAATVQTDQATAKTDTQALQTEIQMVQKTSTVTPAMQAVVSADLAAVQGAASVPANAADVATLKADYTTAMTNSGGPTAAQLTKIQTDQAAVYESQGVGTTLVQKLQSAQAAVTAASGITAAEAGAIYADEQTVQADHTKLQTDVAALPPTTTTTTTTTPATAASALTGGNREFGPGGLMP